MALILCMGAWTVTAKADLIAYWNLDQATDGITYDQIGHGSAALKGNVASAPGQWGGALKFAGGGSYVDCGNAPRFNPEKAITVAAWVKVDVFDQTWQATVTKGDSAWRLQRAADTDHMLFACSNVNAGGGDNVAGVTNVRDGAWHHVVAGYDGAQMFLYIDGRLEARSSATGAIPKNEHPVWIGGNSERLGREWKGSIDEVAIFDHALTARQVAYFHRLGITLFTSRELMGALQKVEKAESALREGKPDAAVRQIQTIIAEYEEHVRQHPRETAAQRDQILCDLYYLMGAAQQAAGAAAADQTASFRKAMMYALDNLHAVPMLTSLSALLATGEFSDLIGRWISANPSQAPEAVYHITMDFVRTGEWSAFETFLDAIFARVDNPRSYVMIVAKGLGDNRPWLNRFDIYCRKNPGLRNHATWSYDGFARYEMERGRFANAIRLYRELLGRCESPEAGASYDYRICRCLFDDGQYAQTADATDAFIKQYPSAKPAVVAQLLLLKGRSCAQLGRADEAAKTFQMLVNKDPAAAEADEAAFLLGYLRMREGNFQESAKILDALAGGRPDSPWAGKARLCLSQIPREAADG